MSFSLDYTWEDLRVPAAAVERNLAGTFPPDWEDFPAGEDTQTLHFDDGRAEYVYFDVQLPHSYEEGTEIRPHVHWCPTNTNTGNVVWRLDYSWASFGQVFGANTTISVTDAAEGTANKHQIAVFPAIDGTGQGISSMLVCRLYRDGGDASDTYNADAAFLEVDFHYIKDAHGSSGEYTK